METPAQSRRLIAAAVDQSSEPLRVQVEDWYRKAHPAFAKAGLRDVAVEGSDAYPLHPLALAVLPELCSRYGQNERTLFSFMAGAEPLAVPAFLDRTQWEPGEALPFVGLDRIYDYFVDSAGSFVGASATASRWLEIETRIRDTAGLKPLELRVLKTIGVLNLVSTSGRLRASRGLIELAFVDGRRDAQARRKVRAALTSLEAAGLITYREFADDYRVWHGSDFDLRGAVERARREVQGRSLAELLNEAAPLEPAIAGRHSQEKGILRVFRQRYADRIDDLDRTGQDLHWDGDVLFLTNASEPPAVSRRRDEAPVVVVLPHELDAVREAAIEAAALGLAVSSAAAESADWVARRELIERAVSAQQAVRAAAHRAWGSDRSTWWLLGNRHSLDRDGGPSAILSNVSDEIFQRVAPRCQRDDLPPRADEPGGQVTANAD